MSFGHICIVALLVTGGATKDQACVEDACIEDEGPDLSELMQLGAAVRKGALSELVQLGAAFGQEGQNSLIVQQATIDRMLDEVKHLGDKRINGHLPPAQQEQMTTIKELLETSLLPSLTNVHSDAQSELQTLIGAISTCNSDSTALHSAIAGSGGVAESVTSSRAGHATCRGDEANKLAAKNTAANDLSQSVHSIPQETFQFNSGTDPLTDGAEAGIGFLGSIETRLCGLREGLVAKKSHYDNVTSLHTSAVQSCNHLQATLEQSYCAWRIELTDACNTLASCYGATVQAYTQRSAAIQTLEAQWKTEFTGIKKIICYVDIWMSDDNVTTVSDEKLAECDSSSIDTSPMDVTYPTAPPQGPCETSQVEQYPGTDAFRTSEYDQFSVTGVAQSVACSPIAGQATTTTTPAAATTTTTPAGQKLMLDPSGVSAIFEGDDDVSNMYGFSEGTANHYISDGGGDMYDSGNSISISMNNGNDNFDAHNGFFGYTNQCSGQLSVAENGVYPDVQYYTCKISVNSGGNTYYVFMAEFFSNPQAISAFRISGGLGADGGGQTRGAVLSAGNMHGYFKTVTHTSDPSVNHLIIVPNGSWTQNFPTNTDLDEHTVASPGSSNNVDHLIYLMWAGNNGHYFEDSTFQHVLNSIANGDAGTMATTDPQ